MDIQVSPQMSAADQVGRPNSAFLALMLRVVTLNNKLVPQFRQTSLNFTKILRLYNKFTNKFD